MVIDDDTFINHVALIRVVDGLDPRTMLVKVTNTYPALSTHPINTSSQHSPRTILVKVDNKKLPGQHILLIHPVNTLYQYAV